MADDTIDISKLDKADVLAALYNASQPLGLGFLHYTSDDMTSDEARQLVEQAGEPPCFDYLKGRVMKVRLTDDFWPGLYDRDNGAGAAARALQPLFDAAD